MLGNTAACEDRLAELLLREGEAIALACERRGAVGGKHEFFRLALEQLARVLRCGADGGGEDEVPLGPVAATALREAIFERLHELGDPPAFDELWALDRVLDDRVRRAVAGQRDIDTEQSFRLLVESVKDYAIFHLDREGHVASWNAGAERIKGYRAREVLGSSFERFYTPEDVAAGVPAQALETARRLGRFEAEGLRVRKDGSRFWADVVITALRSPEGTLLGYAKVTRDITERKRAEEARAHLLEREAVARESREALRRSDMRLRQIVDSNVVGMFFWSLAGPILDANDSFLGLLGYEREDFEAGRLDWRQLTPAEYAVADERAVDEIRRSGQHRPFEKEYLRRDGTRIPVLVASVSYPDDPGHGVSFVMDLRPLHAADRMVRESEARFQAFLAHAPAPIFIKDRAGAYRLVNKAWETLAGRSSAEAVGHTDEEIFGAAAAAVFAGHDRRVLEGGETLVDVEEPVVIGGERRVFRSIKFPLSEAGVERRELCGISIDVTAGRRTEAELDRVFSDSPDLLGVLGYDFTIKKVNPAFTTFLGLSKAELMSRSWLDFVHPDDRAAMIETTRAMSRGRPARRALDRVLGGDGRYRWFAWNASPIEGEDAFVAVGREFTEEKERFEFERKLIGIVSHDLKNPLAAIHLGATALLRRSDELDERALRTVGRIVSSADRALVLIRDLLDFTRARLGGGIPIQRRDLDFHEQVRRVVDEVSAAFQGREVRLASSGDGAGHWDPARVGQVVQNLLVNALTYSPPDSAVQVTTSGDEASVRLEIRNEGDPIPADELSGIFEPLRRARTCGAQYNVGLGLYIVDQIVRGHGGRVQARSSQDEGTVFTVELPRRPPPLPRSGDA